MNILSTYIYCVVKMDLYELVEFMFKKLVSIAVFKMFLEPTCIKGSKLVYSSGTRQFVRIISCYIWTTLFHKFSSIIRQMYIGRSMGGVTGCVTKLVEIFSMRIT